MDGWRDRQAGEIKSSYLIKYLLQNSYHLCKVGLNKKYLIQQLGRDRAWLSLKPVTTLITVTPWILGKLVFSVWQLHTHFVLGCKWRKKVSRGKFKFWLNVKRFWYMFIGLFLIIAKNNSHEKFTFLSVAKDLANHWTDKVLFYRSRVGL